MSTSTGAAHACSYEVSVIKETAGRWRLGRISLFGGVPIAAIIESVSRLTVGVHADFSPLKVEALVCTEQKLAEVWMLVLNVGISMLEMNLLHWPLHPLRQEIRKR